MLQESATVPLPPVAVKPTGAVGLPNGVAVSACEY